MAPSLPDLPPWPAFISVFKSKRLLSVLYSPNLDHSLPLTVGEFDEFGNAKENKKHFDYIRSYSPYENIKKMDYPHIFITTSLSDNRVLFFCDELLLKEFFYHHENHNLIFQLCNHQVDDQTAPLLP